MANAFQTVRLVLTSPDHGCQVDDLSIPSIHSLTHSRLQSGLVSAFSVVSFIVGVVTIVTTWAEKL